MREGETPGEWKRRLRAEVERDAEFQYLQERERQRQERESNLFRYSIWILGQAAALISIFVLWLLVGMMLLGFAGGLAYTMIMLVLYALGLVDDWRWAK
jgi:hypothetical protein